MNDLISKYRVRYKQLLKGSKELYKGEIDIIKELLDKHDNKEGNR